MIPNGQWEEFAEEWSTDLELKFSGMKDAELSTQDFSFYNSVASVFSSRIEGEEIELDSFVKHRRFQVEFQADYTQKANDLYDAYSYAQQHTLNRDHLSEAHRLLSQHFLKPHHQGRIRTQNMYVMTKEGSIQYVAPSPDKLDGLLEDFYHDLDHLLGKELKMSEAFFLAAMLHLVFVHLHLWMDGNGRCARLLEKWFLAEKLGHKAWFLQSERYYHDHRMAYYAHLASLGVEYPSLDYSKSLPFISMLTKSITWNRT